MSITCGFFCHPCHSSFGCSPANDLFLTCGLLIHRLLLVLVSWSLASLLACCFVACLLVGWLVDSFAGALLLGLFGLLCFFLVACLFGSLLSLTTYIYIYSYIYISFLWCLVAKNRQNKARLRQVQLRKCPWWHSSVQRNLRQQTGEEGLGGVFDAECRGQRMKSSEIKARKIPWTTHPWCCWETRPSSKDLKSAFWTSLFRYSR